eukprot:scaffold408_cov347-Pavlova_lutheri.AAC.41
MGLLGRACHHMGSPRSKARTRALFLRASKVFSVRNSLTVSLPSHGKAPRHRFFPCPSAERVSIGYEPTSVRCHPRSKGGCSRLVFFASPLSIHHSHTRALAPAKAMPPCASHVCSSTCSPPLFPPGPAAPLWEGDPSSPREREETPFEGGEVGGGSSVSKRVKTPSHRDEKEARAALENAAVGAPKMAVFARTASELLREAVHAQELPPYDVRDWRKRAKSGGKGRGADQARGCAWHRERSTKGSRRS